MTCIGPSWITLIVGVLVVVGVVATVSQRTRADNRAQSWQRITWCLERTVSDNDEESELGWDVFSTVAATPFIAKTDRRTLRVIADRTVTDPGELAKTAATSDNETQTETEDPR